MKNTNMHNAGIWNAPDGSSFLVFPGNEAGQVFITGVDGKLVHTIRPPEGGVDLGTPSPTITLPERGLLPTDVDQLDGLYT